MLKKVFFLEKITHAIFQIYLIKGIFARLSNILFSKIIKSGDI